LKSGRIAGLDLARYLALAGMVLVNFRLALHPVHPGPAWLEWLFAALEGKASATFVVLAGLGLALATRAQAPIAARYWTTRRALFLLPIGLLNMLVFPADIIHYYAFYFLLALPWLQSGKRALCLGILSLAGLSNWALLNFDYGAGWDWTTLQYADLWTANGFFRNTFFNGFHPVLPWLALLLYGMLLAQLPLQHIRTQWALVATGLSMVGAAFLLAWLGQDTHWSWLLGTGPLPPGPGYLLLGMGSASTVISACLLIERHWPNGPWTWMLPAGRMTLSLYLAHIFIGMGLLEEVGALNGTWSLQEAALAACAFLAAATPAAWLWALWKPQGPVESLMRRLTAQR